MRRRVGRLTGGVLGVALIAMSAQAQAGGCEDGILDAGTDGMNVLIYELCPQRLTVGFESSDVIEEMSCAPDGDIRLWLRANNARCDARPASDHDRAYELLEPLRGVGRSTAAPVRQLLTCRGGTMNRATIVVPAARDAILETRTGDTTYEQLSRRFISRCSPRPDV
ncbi:MAG: hypothetical protein Q8M19_27880 [Reyranella sp.]|nr:hypothetical protein [Reyranella sp.]